MKKEEKKTTHRRPKKEKNRELNIFRIRRIMLTEN